MEDREAKGPPVTLPDGSTAKRVPGFKRWMWDGEFCGSIGLRWQPGTTALPPHCLGHIGYAVVPWKQGRGYAKSALSLILREAREVGLPYVEITTDPDNIASQRVITANGGVWSSASRSRRNSEASLGCAFASLYAKAPNQAMNSIAPFRGGFVVFVATPCSELSWSR
jgi:predicted acetyltransferase